MINDLPAADVAAPSPPEARLAPELGDVVHGSTPLTAAANPLLNLIPQLRAMPTHADPAALRAYVVAQIHAFEMRAKQAGIRNDTIIGARYCLCTALDETVAQTPWGGSGVWSTNSLLVTFHNEAWGGEKFFQLLSRLAQNPQQHIELLELMNACLAMGFEGRYRIVDNGRAQLETLRQRLVDIIRTARGQFEPALALHWNGAPDTGRRGLRLVPFWIVGLLALVAGTGIYYWFHSRIVTQSDPAIASIYSIKMPPPPPAIKPVPPPLPRLRRFLEPEIAQRLVEVEDNDAYSKVTLLGESLFDSGSPDIKASFLPALRRVARALDQVNGDVVVRGYTDDVRIGTRRFQSNIDLSQARADAVKRLLEQDMARRGRVRAEGRGEADPLVPNTNAENRARNRRVEITLELAPAEIERQLNTPR
ncbi:MAG TPA: DotU family type VI secretion system protein [Burkholderiales bacterium]|nr:DotU family type VI secretion system protein [Burkholderiales bacterium]